MVSVSSEARRFLNFDYAYLTAERDGVKCFCEITAVSLNEWVIRAEISLAEGRRTLHVHFKTYELEYLVSLSKTENKNFYKALIFHADNKPEREIEFENKIAHLEENEAFWNKRRETRVVIGEGGFERFGLSSIKQDVYIAGDKYPCVINDVSPNGLRFTTYAHDYLSAGSKLRAGLLFINPLERAEVEGVIRNVVIKEAEGGRRAAFVSMELDNPPEIYKRRLEGLG